MFYRISKLPRTVVNGYSRTLTPEARKRIVRMARLERTYAPRWLVRDGIRARVRLALGNYAANGRDQ